MKALLLVNVGSPDGEYPGPSIEQVKRYLDEFLMDPYVVDLPYAFRWFLVKQLILRTRPKYSAGAYAKIWTREGSPLRLHADGLARGLGTELGGEWAVRVAMRY